jgi:hypothetical protein
MEIGMGAKVRAELDMHKDSMIERKGIRPYVA